MTRMTEVKDEVIRGVIRVSDGGSGNMRIETVYRGWSIVVQRGDVADLVEAIKAYLGKERP